MGYVFPGKLVPVTGVQVIGDHKLRLTFEDGIVGDVAFDSSEWWGIAEPLADQSFFAQVRVYSDGGGTIFWPNGFDMAPEPLYEEACRHPVLVDSSATAA
jgi:hypothetical protein